MAVPCLRWLDLSEKIWGGGGYVLKRYTTLFFLKTTLCPWPVCVLPVRPMLIRGLYTKGLSSPRKMYFILCSGICECRTYKRLLGCVSLRESIIGFLNPKESENGFCVSLLNRVDFFGSFDAPWSEISWIDLFSRETQNPFSVSLGFKNPVLDFLKKRTLSILLREMSEIADWYMSR